MSRSGWSGARPFPCPAGAPDIAGTQRANPTAMLLSAGPMLDWLGARHGVPACVDAAEILERAIEAGFRAGAIRPIEQGGTQTTTEVAQAVLGLL